MPSTAPASVAPRLFHTLRTPTVLVAALGYFVDLFDLTLYGVVRQASLAALGASTPSAALAAGVMIYNAQMAGMIIGGLGWGLLADRRGRRTVLMGSILLYSIATLANAFVRDVPSYALCRFVAGVGLAGELGAAITLVAEGLPRAVRGLGTTLVATLGMLGVTAAAVIGQRLSWQAAYLVGGGLGLLLLVVRARVSESALFLRTVHARAAGPRVLLTAPARRRYLACIVAGVPIYFSNGVLLTFAPEIAAGLGSAGTITAGNAILVGSLGLVCGDLLSGVLSQLLRSRTRVILLCLGAGYGILLLYTRLAGTSALTLYLLTFAISLCMGYWAVLLTLAAEQFGTNVRGTVATTVPNFVRGSALAAVSAFGALNGRLPAPTAALLVGSVCFALAALAVKQLDETFARDLDYVES